MTARHPHVSFHPPGLAAPFGSDRFGRAAEAFARLFGTPGFLLVQTVLVAVWIAVNVLWAHARWDPYPFILLNLAFSVQAAYAAPLILLAQTRQADRDKALAAADVDAREALARERRAEAERLASLIEANTALADDVAGLIRELHRSVLGGQDADASA